MSRESEAVSLLRADATLTALLPGGIYAASDLGDMGLTDPITTPDAYEDGELLPSAVVRQRALVPAFDVRDLQERVSSASQVLEVYVYSLDSDTIEAALDRIYTLLQGYAFDRAYPAAWAMTVGPLDTPEIPNATMARMDFQIVSVRR